MLQIPVGAQLTFIRDNSVVCEEVAARCSLTGGCAWSAKPAGRSSLFADCSPCLLQLRAFYEVLQ